ncbi:MAG: BrnT family toxin [Candidatus Odyssella sp.]|nr:BrnT family toxin [Candidatus Odyssella sp.]
MLLEWDQRKADLNYRKHGVSFEEAATALEDKLSKVLPDPDHSDDEERFVAFAMSPRGRLLVIAHTFRGDRIRLISARRATPQERRIYEEEGFF